jgi:hypothetical protein
MYAMNGGVSTPFSFAAGALLTPLTSSLPPLVRFVPVVADSLTPPVVLHKGAA